MKRITSLILLVVMLLSLSVTVSATQESVHLYVDGKYVQNANGFIENGRTMVPVRALAEKMNADVLWIESEKKVVLNKTCDKMEYNGTTYNNVVASCELILGKAEIRIKLLKDDKEIFNVLKKIDCIANAINGRTHIPARFVGYAMGYSVEYRKELSGSKVYYNFTGKQTIDFEEPAEQTPNTVTSEKYPDTITVNGETYPSRNGYDDIIIVDTSKGKIENDTFINLLPYRFVETNIIIESDEKEYEISNNNTPDQNLSNFAKFYEDKVGEDVITKIYPDGEKVYSFEYLTNKSIGIKSVLGTSSNAGRYMNKYLKDSMYYEIITSSPPIYDYSMWYNICQYDNGFYGQKFYGTKDDSFLRKGSNKNTLLFLNAFLGETGQRISKMMSDYYTFSGYFYVPENSKWDFFYDNGTPKPFNSIDKNAVDYYGLNFVGSYDEGGQYILVLKTNNQEIYIEYNKPNIEYALTSGYNVAFEKIEN